MTTVYRGDLVHQTDRLTANPFFTWRDRLAAFLCSMEYTDRARAEVLYYAERNGTVECCEYVDAADRAALESVLPLSGRYDWPTYCSAFVTLTEAGWEVGDEPAAEPAPAQAFGRVLEEPQAVCPECGSGAISPDWPQRARGGVCDACGATWHVVPSAGEPKPGTPLDKIRGLEALIRREGGLTLSVPPMIHVVPPEPAPEPARVVTSYPPDPAFGRKPTSRPLTVVDTEVPY